MKARTIRLRGQYWGRLLKVAARLGGKDLSVVVDQAIESYAREVVPDDEKRRAALSLRGSLPDEEAEKLRHAVVDLRSSWR